MAENPRTDYSVGPQTTLPPNVSPITTYPTSHSPGLRVSSRPESPTRKRRRSSRQSSPAKARTRPVHINTASKSFPPASIYSPPLLTGAAAIIDEQRARVEQAIIEGRQTSPNPARNKTLQDLFTSRVGGMYDTNNSPKALTPTTTADMRTSVAPVAVKPTDVGDDNMQTSPQSSSSYSSSVKTQMANAATNGAPVSSPHPIDDRNDEEAESVLRDDQRRHTHNGSSYDEGRKNHAFTFPGPVTSHVHRTASLPQSGFGRDSARSPSKRHKCPYCSTDFTRHHNLKSHLLTHSHEKPYSCDTCDSRFRRLHDLKRHTKLHTGERPHVCPRCDRSFARGDALARHNKGQGGCAGRRSSIGSLGADEKDIVHRGGDRDSMPGIMYTEEASHEPENMEEDATDQRTGRSLPSIRRHDIVPDSPDRQALDFPSMHHQRQPSTYPPIAGPPSTSGGLYPPPSPGARSGSNTSTAPSSVIQLTHGPVPSTSYQSSGPNVFAQGSMTESPKPLSPGGMQTHQLGHSGHPIHRNRSPSLTEQLQQTQFGRRGHGHKSPPQIGLPPPPSGGSHSSAPQLPPLQGLTPPEPRFTLHSQAGGSAHMRASATNSVTGSSHGQHSPSFPPPVANSSTTNSLSSHSTGPHSSLDRNGSNGVPPSDRLWAYILNLEAKVNRLEDEVITLKSGSTGHAEQR